MQVQPFGEFGNKFPVTQIKPETPPVINSNYFDFEGMDRRVSPGDDFYTYANGKWLENNPIPDAYRVWGSFQIQRKKVNDRLVVLLRTLSGNESQEAGLCKAFYESASNQKLRNQAGILPLQHMVDAIDAVDSVESLLAVTAELMKVNVQPFADFGIRPHPNDVKKTIVCLQEGGVGLPDYEMYLEEKDTLANAHSEKRAKYRQYISDLLTLAGFPDASLPETVVRVETKLSKAHMSKEDRRNPDKTTNISTVEGFWSRIFAHWGIAPGEVNVQNPQFLSRVEELLTSESLDDLKVYLKFCLLNAYTASAGEAMQELHFRFYTAELRGVKVQLPFEERMTEVVSTNLAQAIGKLYVQKYFFPADKERVLDMIATLKEVFIDKITYLDWMQEPTKRAVIEKINKMVIEIGYPDDPYWFHYADLALDSEKPHLENCLALARFKFLTELNKLQKPLEKKEWSCYPHEVNAYNSTNKNKMTFPAGILEYPFLASDEATTWGAIGWIISHEIIHSFDDQGRKYDSDGNKADWWQKEDAQAFEAHAQRLVEQFNALTVTFADGTSDSINGQVTLGENIADFGGLKLAFAAMKKMGYQNRDGFTAEQRFFLGYAQVMRENIRDTMLKLRMGKDVHSPSYWRVNAPLSQMKEFQEAFNLSDFCPMVRPQDQRSTMWG